MIDPLWFGVGADLLINLGAGWLAAAFLLPDPRKRPRDVDFFFAIANAVTGSFALVLAFFLRTLGV